MRRQRLVLVASCMAVLVSVVSCATDPNDLAVIQQFRKGQENPEILNWPSNNDDPCGPPRWNHIVCQGNRVTQIQVQNMGLKGTLPKTLNRLSKLDNIGLQRNQFTGDLPSLNGLSLLRFAFLDYNNFDTIPFDFFNGLSSLQTLALDSNPLNASTGGWSLPLDLQNSPQLSTFSAMNCNLAGPIPEFLGTMPSLTVLKLAMNRLSGSIPLSFEGSILQTLWLNEQIGEGMSGPIDVVASMVAITSLWLHGNHFSGKIPEDIGELTSLKDFNVNSNDLVGLLPDGLASLELDKLDLNNNKFVGPIPELKAVNCSYSSNSFCQLKPGIPCSNQVMPLLEFLDAVNYPTRLLSSWSGDDPCLGNWVGIHCDSSHESTLVDSINLVKFNLSGTLTPSLAMLSSLSKIQISFNYLNGPIPNSWTSLKSLALLDLSYNNLSGSLPNFSKSVKLVINDNPLLNSIQPKIPPSSPPRSPSSSNIQFDNAKNITRVGKKGSEFFNIKLVVIVAPVAIFLLLVCLVVPLSIYFCKKRKRRDHEAMAISPFVVHPKDQSGPDNLVKIAVTNDKSNGGGSRSINSSSSLIEAGSLVISVQVLRKITQNFSPENELGRGGFGVVYKGEFEDGTKIAVKRMEAGLVLSSKPAMDEFQAEIEVLSKVRHRHLVSLLGYSMEGMERILVYEYMSEGALSKHLFHWKKMSLEPLSWKRRLNIALDVARGMEYLHSLAHQSFIHRDLKPCNILLDHDFKAKVSDFGLVKLAPPGGEKSLVTKLAGTFGYLAPEYAVMGKITTKSDVFSFGVVLMELLTGLTALDEERPEESQYLVSWFWQIKSDKERLMGAVDPVLEAKEDDINVVAELAGHCTAREPSQRPEMGHAVNVLARLVEKWKPLHEYEEEDDGEDYYCGIDYSLPLNQMVKGWQQADEGNDSSYVDLDDSKSSIPARPTGFADSFTSADGR